MTFAALRDGVYLFRNESGEWQPMLVSDSLQYPLAPIEVDGKRVPLDRDVVTLGPLLFPPKPK